MDYQNIVEHNFTEHDLAIKKVFLEHTSQRFLEGISVFKIIRDYFDLLSLPIIYFVIKIYFYSSSGKYYGYNSVYSLFNLINSPVTQLFDFSKLNVNVLLLLVFTLLTFLVLKKTNFSND